MHGAQAGLVALRVELETVEPDVLPEAQAHHIQVFTTITEGTGQLHKHCQQYRSIRSLTSPDDSNWKRGVCYVTFSVSKIFGVQLYNTICKLDIILLNSFSSLHGHTDRRGNIPTLSTLDTLSTQSLFPRYRVSWQEEQKTTVFQFRLFHFSVMSEQEATFAWT